MKAHDTPRTSGWRLTLVAASMLAALSLPLSEGCGSCPELRSAYRIVTDRPDWVMSSGKVELTDTAIVITYSTKDGSSWEVEYKRVTNPNWD